MNFIHSYMDAVGGFLKTESDTEDTHQLLEEREN